MNSKDPDLLRRKGRCEGRCGRAPEIGLKTGTPVYGIKKGQIVDLIKQTRRKTKRNINHLGE